MRWELSEDIMEEPIGSRCHENYKPIDSRKCGMIGCKDMSVQNVQIAPGTTVELCLKHYLEEVGDNALQKFLDVLSPDG